MKNTSVKHYKKVNNTSAAPERRAAEKRSSRTAKLNRLKIIAALSIILAVTAVVSIAGISKASAGVSVPEKHYKSITVASGDTLWSIADEYMDDSYYDKREYIKELKSLNNISSDNITAGLSLLVI
ncbi:MAG: LysM peptidoglycan-binding domain-containing protein, partial [Parasporobacterium sp.]|nr:LysM peptidoglycan-binding domain-containing protein [Parasporobacterium sp.]